MPHMPINFDVFDLKVGNGGFKMRIPVYEAFPAINQSLIVHLNKNFENGIVKITRLFCGRCGFCARHGESGALPIHAVPQATRLLFDDAAFVAFPRPDFGKKFVALHFRAFATLAIFCHLLFDHELGRNTRVIKAWLPERVIALHALPARKDVHERMIKGVPDMKVPRHIGRGQHDAKALFAALICACCKAA